MAAYGDSDWYRLDPAAVVPGNVRIVRDDAFAEEHELRTRARCDRYYRILLNGAIPLGFVGIVEYRIGDWVSAAYKPRARVLAAGASEDDALVHVNEFYPFAFVPELHYEQVKRRGIGTKVMQHVLDDARSDGFRWAYVSLSSRRALSRLLENVGFSAVDNDPLPLRYVRRL